MEFPTAYNLLEEIVHTRTDRIKISTDNVLLIKKNILLFMGN